jgi:decaprenyl-phosphate phosphoribosyltransferase
MRTFLDLDEHALAHALVIIDVDGTITHDKGKKISHDIATKIRKIAAHADVYLFSNGLRDRTRVIAEDLGVHYLDSKHRKPSHRVIESLPVNGKRMVVIGDKVLTDQWFAVNIGAEFILVERMRGAADSRSIRAVNLFDDSVAAVSWIVFPILPYITLLRPKQWIKNVLVLAPVFFAAEALDSTLVQKALAAAAIFCVASSVVYVLNDIVDASHDRLHPRKRARPIASGIVPASHAWALFFVLFVLLIFLLAMLPIMFPVIAIYVLGNLLYTLFLKHIAIVDIAAVAFFYVLRVLAGGIATATYVSPWIILCALFGALFIIIGKRRAEFARETKRRVLDSYSKQALDALLVAAATLAITSYGLYSVLGTTKSPYAVYSTFFVFAAIFRLVNRMYAEDEDAEYPETLVFKDPWVLLVSVLWLGYMFILFYLHL